ncbi:hypothetical protein OAB00_01265 [Akkermansiaceae bacterium]|nr:hypothetical protein [Akkermansiaceae bacterium]
MQRLFFLHSRVDAKKEQTHEQALISVAKAKNIPAESLLKLPELRESAIYIINYYFDIACLSEVSYTSIKDWSKVRRIKLESFEVDLIILIHNTRLKCNQM